MGLFDKLRGREESTPTPDDDPAAVKQAAVKRLAEVKERRS